MKRLLLPFLLIAFLASSQVDSNRLIVTKYADFYDYNRSKKEYVHNNADSGWLDINIKPEKDYYLIEIDNDGEESKVWWEHSDEKVDSFDADEHDIYYTEDGRKVIFWYNDQEIYFYGNYSESLGRYLDLMKLTKIETYER
jgi:hypothetical protein